MNKLSVRKRGGQPGNKNALRHGFYSRHFTLEENVLLDGQRPDFTDEISLARVFADRITKALQSDFDPTEENLKKVHTLMIILASIANGLRSNSFINGTNRDVDAAIIDAVISQSSKWDMA